MKDKIRILLSSTALPLVLVFMLLSAGGIALQNFAYDEKSDVLLINVDGMGSLFSGAGITEELEGEASEGVPVSTLCPEADRLVGEGRINEAAGILKEFLAQSVRTERDPETDGYISGIFIKAGLNKEALSVLEPLAAGSCADPGVYFNIGLARSRLGDKAGAISAYREAVRLRPAFYEALYNMGCIYIAQDRLASAIRSLEQAAASSGGERRSAALCLLGNAYRKTGAYGRAEEAYLDAVNLFPSSLRPRFGLAVLYTETGRLPEAEDAYNEILLLDEDNGEAYKGLSDLALARGDKNEAVSILEEGIALAPDYDEARIKLADLLIDKGDITKAENQLLLAADNSRLKPEALFRLGRLEYGRGRYNKALDYYEEADRYFPAGNPGLYNNKGLALKASGDRPGARTAFRAALEADNKYYAAVYNLALLDLEDDEADRAEEGFLAVTEMNPEFAEGWYNLAYARSLMGLYRESVKAYEEVLRIDPSNIKARLNLAVQYKKAGELRNAGEQYRLLIAMNPSYPAAWYNHGLLCRETGNYLEAERSYRKAIELDPAEERYWLNLSAMLAELGRTESAAEVLNEALDYSSSSVLLRYNLALQYRKLGRQDRAKDQIEKALALDPEFLKGWLILGNIYSDADEHGKAAEAFGIAAGLESADYYTRYQYGKELFRAGRFSEAAESLGQASTGITDNPWIWYYLGRAELQLGRKAAADEAFRKSAEIEPEMLRRINNEYEEFSDSVSLAVDLVEE